MEMFSIVSLCDETGSVITANSSGEATRALQKITIDGVTYKIVGVAYSEQNYSSLVTLLNSAAKETYLEGASIYIVTIDVPDLWIYSNDEATSVPYTYTTDAQFIADLNAAGGTLQIGHYKVAIHEGEKVDLTNYPTFTDLTTRCLLINGTTQTISDANKEIARTNLGVPSIDFTDDITSYTGNADIVFAWEADT